MKQFLLMLLATLLLVVRAMAQSDVPAEGQPVIYHAIETEVNNIFDSLITVRRDLHRHPELSGQEQRTAEKIAQYLSALGLEVKTNVGGYGVVGILQGAKQGKHVAWRADIDAMPSDIPAQVDFKSENKGVRHICGHDVHTTVALGIAHVLAKQRNELTGTIYFVFQPSEENLRGAQAMIDDGLFDLIDPEEMYALHITPFPAGTIAAKPQELFADFKQLSISLQPSSNRDTLVEFARQQILQLENVKPESRFWDMMNMGDPEIGIAGPNSIYTNYTLVSGGVEVEEVADSIILTAYIRTSDQEQREAIVPHLKEQFRQSDLPEELWDIRLLQETPTLLNHDALVAETLTSLASRYGRERVISLTGVVADGRSDDFALFQQRVPAVYFFLGGSNYEIGAIAQPHSPGFLVDESCIKTGVQFFSAMLVDRLAVK